MEPIIHITFAVFYEFNGWKFEYDRRKPFGPWPVKNDFEPRARAGKKFYSMFAEFYDMPIEQQEKYRL